MAFWKCLIYFKFFLNNNNNIFSKTIPKHGLSSSFWARAWTNEWWELYWNNPYDLSLRRGSIPPVQILSCLSHKTDHTTDGSCVNPIFQTTVCGFSSSLDHLAAIMLFNWSSQLPANDNKWRFKLLITNPKLPACCYSTKKNTNILS